MSIFDQVLYLLYHQQIELAASFMFLCTGVWMLVNIRETFILAPENKRLKAALNLGHFSCLIQMEYTNYKGNKSIRKILPIRVYWGKTEYHPVEQLLLVANDIEKGERTFAVKDISSWACAQPERHKGNK